MKKMSPLNKSVITAICIALCVVLPMAMHFIPGIALPFSPVVINSGTLFSPMHIPVLLCGIVCGWQYGLLCGLIGPLLSSLITGMPATAMLPFMMVELAVYGTVTGLCMARIHMGRLLSDLYLSMLIAMLSGRIIAGIAKALFFTNGEFSFTAWVTAYFVYCLPGIVIQLVLIPTLYLALQRAKLVPYRYEAIR